MTAGTQNWNRLFLKKVYLSSSDEKWNALFILDLYEDYLYKTDQWNTE